MHHLVNCSYFQQTEEDQGIASSLKVQPSMPMLFNCLHIPHHRFGPGLSQLTALELVLTTEQMSSPCPGEKTTLAPRT